MRAVFVHEFGSWDTTRVEEVADPSPGAGEVIVELAASEVNFPDVLYIEGRYQRKPSLPFSPGLAGAGVVVEIGEGVTEATLGQRVLVLPEYGTYAERVRVPARFCFEIPDEMSFEIASAFGLVYQTAYFALMARAGFEPGNTVLVLGATGGVGIATVQLAKALGAGRVIATARCALGTSFVKDLGADVVINLTSTNLREAVKDLTDGRGVDIVIDPVGGELTLAAIRSLSWCGILISLGFASGDIPQIPSNYLLVKNVAVGGLQWTDYRSKDIESVKAAQEHIFALWRDGQISPVISSTHELDEFDEALALVRRGGSRGRMILITRNGTEENGTGI